MTESEQPYPGCVNPPLASRLRELLQAGNTVSPPSPTSTPHYLTSVHSEHTVILRSREMPGQSSLEAAGYGDTGQFTSPGQPSFPLL